MIYENGHVRTDTKGKYGPGLYVDFLAKFMKQNSRAQKPFFVYYSMALRAPSNKGSHNEQTKQDNPPGFSQRDDDFCSDLTWSPWVQTIQISIYAACP
jgi:hypothetical protein